MNSGVTIKAALRREVDKLIVRHNRQCQGHAKEMRRYSKRSGQEASPPESLEPPHWSAHSHFNPFYVRPRIRSISHALFQAIRSGNYSPNPSLVFEIPKPGGGQRSVVINSIPDAAASYWIGHGLIKRNAHRFSSNTYAYRADRNAHHAIQHLSGGITGKRRLFVLEYDFSKYFDTIRHDYIEAVLQDNFLVTDRERDTISRLLKGPKAQGVAAYRNSEFDVPECGIPQGSSVSLFLANVACFELDREIEQVGVVFARYADDTLIICDSYEKADRCAKLLIGHGDRSGTRINFEKSPGISLLTQDKNAEFRNKAEVQYLGHSLSEAGVFLSGKSLSRIKRRVGRIIYDNLLLQPQRGEFSRRRVGPLFFDWDLVTCVNELRRYIYGRITERDLSDALGGNGPLNVTRCALSFYPTVSDGTVFKELDGWLCDTLHRAYRKRCTLLREYKIRRRPLAVGKLIDGSWYSKTSIPNETRLPSFYKSWLYVRRVARVHGLDCFPSSQSSYL